MAAPDSQLSQAHLDISTEYDADMSASVEATLVDVRPETLHQAIPSSPENSGTEQSIVEESVSDVEVEQEADADVFGPASLPVAPKQAKRKAKARKGPKGESNLVIQYT